MSLLVDDHLDKLSLDLWVPESPIAQGDEGLDSVLDVIERHAGELMPNTVALGGKRRAKYSREVARRRLRRPQDFGGLDFGRDVWLYRTTFPEVGCGLQFYERARNKFLVSAKVAPLEFFKEPAHAEERSQQVVALLRGLASRYPPTWGYAHSIADELLGAPSHEVREDPLRRLNEVYWLNVLGKELVDGLGRERVLSTPAAHLEELPNGSVLFLTRPTPGDFDSEEARVAQAKALVHLRPEQSYDAVLAKLRERSRAFAPVERDWDPDVAPFLERTLKYFYINKLNLRIAEYNRVRPPPPTEWLPAASAPPPDVDDVASEVRRYEGYRAEQLAALLHTDVPEVMEGTPESLPAIDTYLWHRDFAGYERHKVEGHLIPAVGAYLGKVLVHHLGGRWVPRRNLDEVQVVIGDRAWLPFLRARHHLQTADSAFEYSLTQFYRVVARTAAPRA